MGDLVSSDLPGGYTEEVTADQLNRLWLDTWVHHCHASADGKGAPIPHGELTDEILTDTYLSHAVISEHLQGAGTDTEPDDEGGDSGVHGLIYGQNMLGSTQSQWVIQAGTGTTDRWDEGTHENRGRGTFPTPYRAPPYVLVVNTFGESTTVTVYQRLTTSFAVRLCFRSDSSYYNARQDITFNWIAFGVI